jgi:hypothetical protein
MTIFHRKAERIWAAKNNVQATANGAMCIDEKVAQM